MGDHVRVGRGCCSYKYCKIPEAEKRTSITNASGEKKKLARQGIESILSPKQQRRPLPSLLSLSFFYDLLPGECSCLAEPDGVEEDLGDEGKLGRGHRHRPEQQLQIIRQLLQLVGKIVHRGLCIARPTKHSLPLTKLTTLSSEWTVG